MQLVEFQSVLFVPPDRRGWLVELEREISPDLLAYFATQTLRHPPPFVPALTGQQVESGLRSLIEDDCAIGLIASGAVHAKARSNLAYSMADAFDSYMDLVPRQSSLFFQWWEFVASAHWRNGHRVQRHREASLLCVEVIEQIMNRARRAEQAISCLYGIHEFRQYIDRGRLCLMIKSARSMFPTGDVASLALRVEGDTLP